MNIKKQGRAALATLVAGVAAVALALGGAAVASAAPTIPSVPDPDTRGTLNIHKFQQPNTPGTASDGMVKDTTGLTAMNGVEFTIWKVNGIDLSTNAGWEAAANIADPAAAKAMTSGSGTSVTTAGAGLATFPNLPIGLYYVEETVWPTGATPAAPFVVTVPITNARDIVGSGTVGDPEFPARTTWVYDVHVYPKNAITSGQKSVNDSTPAAVKLGDNVQWTIRGDIPKADPIDAYRIVDALDPRLELVTSGGGAPVLTLTGTSGVTLTPGTSAPTGDYYWTNTAGQLQVDFTPAGRVKLVTAWKADPTAQVQIVLNTTVKSVGDGEIKNQATIYPNQAAIDWEPGDPGQPPVTNEPVTKWGNIVLHKVNEQDENLDGVEFQVFRTEADALAKTNPIAISFNADGSAIIGAPVTTFTTEADGRLLIPGLRYSNWADNATQTPFVSAPSETCADLQAGPASTECLVNAKFQYYWVVETKAKTGYELLADPVRVVVDSPSTDVATADDVVNVPHNAGFELPLTGGMGTALLTIGGIAILAIVLVVARRRQSEEASAE